MRHKILHDMEFHPAEGNKQCFQQVGKHLLSFSSAWAEDDYIGHSIVIFCFTFGPFVVGRFEHGHKPAWEPSWFT